MRQLRKNGSNKSMTSSLLLIWARLWSNPATSTNFSKSVKKHERCIVIALFTMTIQTVHFGFEFMRIASSSAFGASSSAFGLAEAKGMITLVIQQCDWTLPTCANPLLVESLCQSRSTRTETSCTTNAGRATHAWWEVHHTKLPSPQVNELGTNGTWQS